MTSENEGRTAVSKDGTLGHSTPSTISILSCALTVSLYFAVVIYTVYSQAFLNHRLPISKDAEKQLFSEGRAMKHVIVLADIIGNRQEGSAGLLFAASYIVSELKSLQGKAGSRLRFEIDESLVSGSFSINFLTKSMTMAYQNLTNIVVRISNPSSSPDSAAVMVNGHFDSAPYSTGAADCAACVACMLEVIRVMVESDYTPPAPLVFLFNGGEEIFLKAAHGFITTHRWAPQIGAFINLESSGSGMPDVLIQSGPTSWPSSVYSKTAVVPAGTCVSEDVFPFVPGDTDYRIFSHDFDDIPGLDLAYVLRVYSYHTALDTSQNLQPGALQTRGENLLAVLHGLAASPHLATRSQRSLNRITGQGLSSSGAPVYFDLWGHFFVHYSREAALTLHISFFALLWIIPSLSTPEASGSASRSHRYDDMATGIFFYLLSFLLAILLPILLSIVRVAASGRPMNWLSHQYTVPLMFSPAAIAGLLIPQLFRNSANQSPASLARTEWSNHWGGAVGANAFLSAILTFAGAGSGFIPFWWALFLSPALWVQSQLRVLLGTKSPLTLAGHLLLALPPVCFSVQFSDIFIRFVSETMVKSGTHPLPLGDYVPDIIVAAVTAALTAMTIAPLVPAMSPWLARRSVVRLLIYASILSSAFVCRLFPYAPTTPKRVLLQHLYFTQGAHSLVTSEYNVATVDSNDVSFLFQHAPDLVRQLVKPGTTPRLPPTADQLSLYPVSEFLTRSMSVPAPVDSAASVKFPELSAVSGETLRPREGEVDSRRRITAELDFGSLQHVWGAVMNFTGPIVSWSLAGGQLPPAEQLAGGPPSYILHYGGDSSVPYQFWIEALGEGKVRVDVGVLDLAVEKGLADIAKSLPDWIASGISSSYLSTAYL